MALEFAKNKLPPDELQAMLKGLPYFAAYNSADRPMQEGLRDAAQGEGQVWQVFTLTLTDVLPDGKGLNGATAGGWRVAARFGAQVMAGDIYTGDTTARKYPYPLAAGTPRLACVRRGDEISMMLTAIQHLTEPPVSTNIPAQPFNVHLLLLPGLVTDALWLQPQSVAAGASYVVPFHTLIGDLKAGQAYTEQQFFQTIEPVAQQWVNFSKQEESRTSRPVTDGTYAVSLQFSEPTTSNKPPTVS